MCQVDKTYPVIREIFPLEGMNHRVLLKICLPTGIVAFHLGWNVFRSVDIRSRDFLCRDLVLFYSCMHFFPPFLIMITSRMSCGVCICLLYTSPSPRDGLLSRMPS